MTSFTHHATTERLIIRPLQQEDYENWLSSFEARFPARHQYDLGRMDMSDCTQPWFTNLVQKHQDLAISDVAYVFGIFRKTDGTHIGMVDFSTLAREEFQWARLGYTVHNQYWRQGYGSESVQAAIAFAFKELNYNRIEAHINLDNAASIRLAERVGMDFECIRKGFIYENDEWVDHRIHVKTFS